MTPGQASGGADANHSSTAAAAEPTAEEGVPPVSADPAAAGATADPGEDAEPASKKLEKLVKAQQQGALSQDMFHRMVSKATSELPPTEPLRLKLEKLQNALDAGALTPDMYAKMLVKQISAAAAEAEAAAEQAKLLAMFAATPANASSGVATNSTEPEPKPETAEEPEAGANVEPATDAVVEQGTEAGEAEKNGEGAMATVSDDAGTSEKTVQGDC